MKRILTSILFLAAASSAQAQDVHFSQFWNNGTQYNPALAGVIPATFRSATFYRSQWAKPDAPFKSFGANADFRISTRGNAKFGLGMNVYRDVAGDQKFGTTNFQIALSTILQMNDFNRLSLGFNGGIHQKGVDASGAQWNSQYVNGAYDPGIDPGETVARNGGVQPDLSAGFTYIYSSSRGFITLKDQFNFVLGASYNHILKPSFDYLGSADQLKSNIVAHVEAMINIGKKWAVQPAIIAQIQAPSTEVLIGSRYRFELVESSLFTGFVKGGYLNLGTFYRVGDAFIPSISVEMSGFSVGFSYDVNVSKFTTASSGAGGFEISLKIRTPNPYLWNGRDMSRSRFR